MAFGLTAILGALGKTASAAGKVGDVAQSVGGIAGMIPRPDKGRIDAANLQRNVETAAMQIEQAVANGTMDPDAALRALSALQARATQLGLSGDANLQRASQMAAIIITNVKANVESNRTKAMNAPLDERGLYGDPSFQRGQFKSRIGNAMIGNAPELVDTPLGSLFKPKTSIADRMPSVTAKVNEVMPDRIGSEFGNEIRNKLQRYLAGGG